MRDGEVLASGEVLLLDGGDLDLENEVRLQLILSQGIGFVFDFACYYVVIFFFLFVEKTFLFDARLAQSHLRHCRKVFINFILLGSV